MYLQSQKYSFAILVVVCCIEWNKNSDFWIFFGMKSIEQFFFGIRVCHEMIHFVNVLLSIVFQLTARYIFQGKHCTFSKCIHTPSHCGVKFYSFSFVYFLNCAANSFLCRSKSSCVAFFIVIIVKIAQTVSSESFVLLHFATRVLSNRSWRTITGFTPFILLASLPTFVNSYTKFHY